MNVIKPGIQQWSRFSIGKCRLILCASLIHICSRKRMLRRYFIKFHQQAFESDIKLQNLTTHSLRTAYIKKNPWSGSLGCVCSKRPKGTKKQMILPGHFRIFSRRKIINNRVYCAESRVGRDFMIWKICNMPSLNISAERNKSFLVFSIIKKQEAPEKKSIITKN